MESLPQTKNGKPIKSLVNDKNYKSYLITVKAYYAHAMPLYGSEIEKNEKKQIIKNLPKAEIIDPGTFQSNPQKRREGMNYCFKLIKKCNALVFSKFNGKVTAGVGKEVEFALKEKLDVFELNGDKLHKISKPVKYLSVLETINMPEYHFNS